MDRKEILMKPVHGWIFAIIAIGFGVWFIVEGFAELANGTCTYNPLDWVICIVIIAAGISAVSGAIEDRDRERKDKRRG